MTLALCGAFLAAPAARADEEIVAGGGFRYLNPTVTIDQGERLTFRNSDAANHDVVSVEKGSVKQQYLFASDIIGTGETSFVEGSQYLTTGKYDFYCSLHADQMKGTVTVTSNGTPQPRPGSPPPPGGTTQPPPEDITGPELSLRLGSLRASRLKSTRTLRLRLGTDEGARVTLTIRVGKKRIRREVVQFGSAGTRRLAIPLGRTARKYIVRGRKLTVFASATDAAGNPGEATISDRIS